ncbi:MAG: TonB-dependent receptor [Bacteroidales bacterium]|nr:TonB-dependent receptor [Bacteroidales bacterium]
MKKLLLSRTIGVLIFLLCANFMHAQSITITGKVVDALDNSALPGVNVIVQGTQTGAVTDIDGKYSIDVEVGKVLVFSMIGYVSESIEVTTQTEINVALVQDVTQLEEIVVIGYGTQRKVDLTGSVAIVDAEEMKKGSNSNISTMLQGKAAGVQITTDGQPGADPSVRIRGIATFGDASPLYIIDGVPMGTTIRDFSPNDIESLQVLKDASAAAIYGSRAANGVIIITTKQGKKNQSMKIDYSGYFGFDHTPKNVYDVMDSEQYGEYITMSYQNYGLNVPPGYDPTNEKYIDPNEVNTDWFDEVYKTGIRQNHNINLSGGSEKNTYNIALDYYSQKGTMEGAGPNFDRYTARFNNTMDVKFLKFKTNIVYSNSDQDNMGYNRVGDLNAIEYVQGLYGSQLPVMASALLTPPTIKAYDESTWVLDDKISAASNYHYDSYGYGTYYDDVHGDLRVTNVLLTNNLMQRNTNVDRVVASGSAIVDFLEMAGLASSNHKFNYTLNLSYNKTYANDFTFIPSFIQSTTNYLSDDNERLQKFNRKYGSALVENTLNYDGLFGRNHVNLLVGQTYQRETFHQLLSEGINLSEPFFLNVDNSAETQAKSFETEHILASYIGRIIYDFDQKYLFSATVRRDGSSRFAPGNNIGWFPSVSAGWRIERESFFPVDKSIIGLFKVRGSYGELGNENLIPLAATPSKPATSEYQFMSVMQRGDYTYSFGNNKVNGSSISNFVNKNIMWETKKTTDVGIDLAMFRNKVEFTFDWYKSISDNLLYEVAVPANAGVTNTTVMMNAATIENSGLEFLLAYHNHDHGVKYDISANLSTLKNKVTKLGISGEPRTDRTDFRTEIGSEVGQFYGLVYEGIFQSQEEIDTRTNEEGELVNQDGAQPGDVRYADINNDGEITLEGDRQILGSGLPNVSYGLNVRVEWNGFDLSIFAFGAAGFKAIDYVHRSLISSYGTNNKDVSLLNAWTPENTNTDVPRVAYRPEGSITNDMFSSRFMQDASYLKIANIQLGYNFPEKLFGGFVQGLRVYSSVQNLATLSKYKGYNADFLGGTFTPGYNFASYPTPRTFMFGLQASF